METISKVDFESKCALLHEGYEIVGENGEGIIMEDSISNSRVGARIVVKICTNCDWSIKKQGNCNSSAEEEFEPATVFAALQ